MDDPGSYGRRPGQASHPSRGGDAGETSVGSTGKEDGSYWTIFQSVPVAFYLATPEGRLLDVNLGVFELLGWPLDRTALLSLTLDQLYENAADWAQLRARVEAEGVVLGAQALLRRFDGSTVWAEHSVRTIRWDGGETVRYAGSLVPISHWKRREERLLHDALHDPLTHLANRALFLDRLQQVIARQKRDRQLRFSVLFLDLDGFKDVNDRYGHLLGDELLIAVARRLESTLRPGDTVARFGGDEFVILLEGLGTEQEAAIVAERIQEALSRPYAMQNRTIHISASIGITLATAAEQDAETLIHGADTAMYVAKAAGGGRFFIAEPAP